MIWKSDLQRQINALNDRLKIVENMDFRIEFAKIQTEVLSLRGLMNRKLSKKGIAEDEPEDPNNKYGNGQCLPT